MTDEAIGRINGVFVGGLLGIAVAACTIQAQSKAPHWETELRPRTVIVRVQAETEAGMEQSETFAASRPESFKEVALTDEERELLIGIAQAEAGNQGAEGMALVMMTVLNRTKDAAFPHSVRDVIFQKGQFSAAKNIGKQELTQEAYEALRMVEAGWDESHGALYFEATWVKDSFQQKHCRLLFTHKGHRFYL